jgi:hypothetical protein
MLARPVPVVTTLQPGIASLTLEADLRRLEEGRRAGAALVALLREGGPLDQRRSDGRERRPSD